MSCLLAPGGKETPGVRVELWIVSPGSSGNSGTGWRAPCSPQREHCSAQTSLALEQVLCAGMITAEIKSWWSPQMSKLCLRSRQDLSNLWLLLHPHRNLATVKKQPADAGLYIGRNRKWNKELQAPFLRNAAILLERHSKRHHGHWFCMFLASWVRGGNRTPGRRPLSNPQRTP